MIEEADRGRIEKAMLAYKAFNFAVKAVTSGLGLSPTSEEYWKIWKVVEDVAAGEAVLSASAGEIIMNAGAITEKLREAHVEGVNRTIRQDKELASELVAAREGFCSPKQR